MSVTKIMIIRHAENPGVYNDPTTMQQVNFPGVDQNGNLDPESLALLGWQRAKDIANLLTQDTSQIINSELATPDFIYASNPSPDGEEKSKRPYETVLPLSLKTKIAINSDYEKKHFKDMIKYVLNNSNGTVLISWQHEDILPKDGSGSIVAELINQTGSNWSNLKVPTCKWPGDRYDMIFVFDRPTGTGPFTSFTQVPQMLLAGDSKTPIG